jgi:putative acetyltransferase
LNQLIREETSSDHDSIRMVNRLAFGQDDEATLVDLLRIGGYVQLSLVAERYGQVVGHILFSEMAIITAAGRVPASALAPMAVLPEFQNQGIGSALVQRGLEMCRDQGHRIALVVGHPHFYPKFGFSCTLAAQLDSPFAGESFMALELVAGSLDGVTGQVQYSAPFTRWM